VSAYERGDEPEPREPDWAGACWHGNPLSAWCWECEDEREQRRMRQGY
jgi:hypothetical protein